MMVVNDAHASSLNTTSSFPYRMNTHNHDEIQPRLPCRRIHIGQEEDGYSPEGVRWPTDTFKPLVTFQTDMLSLVGFRMHFYKTHNRQKLVHHSCAYISCFYDASILLQSIFQWAPRHIM